MRHFAGLTGTLSVLKPISRSIDAIVAKINYSNAPRYAGAKLARIHSYLTDGSGHCQLRISGIYPFTHDDVASVWLSNTLLRRVKFLTVNPVGVDVCALAHTVYSFSN